MVREGSSRASRVWYLRAQSFNLFARLCVDWSPPASVPDTIGNHRWFKFYEQVNDNQEHAAVRLHWGRYICRYLCPSDITCCACVMCRVSCVVRVALVVCGR